MNQLRLGGYGVTSKYLVTFVLPKFDTSGSRPVYAVQVLRFRPLTSRRTARAELNKALVGNEPQIRSLLAGR